MERSSQGTGRDAGPVVGHKHAEHAAIGHVDLIRSVTSSRVIIGMVPCSESPVANSRSMTSRQPRQERQPARLALIRAHLGATPLNITVSERLSRTV
jgi:hypothetical protein